MNAPKLRLQGFTGEWESRQIGEISTFAKGSGYSKSDLCMTGVPIILYGRMYTKYSFEMDNIDTFAIHKDGAVYSKGTEVVIPASGETAEDIAVAASIKQEGVILGGDLNILTFEDSFLPSFMALCISHGKTHFELSRYAQGKSVVHLRNNDIAKAQITTPCIYEQQKIVDYFKNLESLIDATAKKIESLKQVKAACLQSMFPQPGEGKPRLRFKEYDDNWDVLPLSTFARKSTEKNTALEYNITLTNSAEYGVINQLDFFDHDISNDNHIDRYYVIHNDDFVYNPRVSTFAPVGPINRNTLGYSGVMSPLYLIFKVDDINKDFLAYFFKTTLWHQYMKLEGNTGARFDRLALSDSQFFNMPIYVPKQVKEQEDIASFFSNLDKQISLYEHRLEKLTNIKSACLDGMFI